MTRTSRSRGGSRSARNKEVVADRLHSAAIHLLRRLRHSDKAGGLSAARLSALSVLVFGGPRTIGQLAEAEQVRPPTMTRLLQALEAEGCIERTPDPDDGRIVRVQATAKAKRLLREARRRRVHVLVDLMSPLKTDEVRRLGRAADLIDEIAARNET